MREVDSVSLAKSILWEEAKGKLRAIVAAEGQATKEAVYYDKLARVVEKFIKDFETQGLHE